MPHPSRFRVLASLAALLLLMVTLLAGCSDAKDVPASTCAPSGTANSGPFDISGSSILVTQAIQTTSPLNSVPLVAQRSTAVRVMLTNGGNGYVSGVTGTLSVSVDGTAIPLGAHAAPINGPIPAPVAPQWANECHTLNFEIAAPTGITASSNVKFHVEITPVSGETNTANNSGDATLSFAGRTTPLLFFTRIDFAGKGLPDMSFVQPGTGDAFVRGIYPVDDSDPNLYRQGKFPTLPWADANGNNIVDAYDTEGNNLLSFLAQCRQLMVNEGFGPDDRVFLYGWLKGNPTDSNGLSPVGGRVGYGNSDPVRGQRTYAHELGHQFGLDPINPITYHNNDVIGEVGWDIGGRLANNPASNNVAADGRVKPTSYYDIMNAGQVTNQAWIEPRVYKLLYNNTTLATSPDAGSPDKEVAVIQGIFDPTGNKLLRLNPVFRYPWPSVPTRIPPEQKNRYLAVITTNAGAVVRVPFDALISPPEGEKAEVALRRGFFEVQAKVSGDIALLQLVDTQTGKVITERTRAVPPTIALTTPAPGDRLGDTTTLSWEPRYSVPDDQVLYQVAYSPDNGQTFVPLAVGVPGDTRTITVNTREIQKSSGQGVIRVFLSDGLNTAYADVTGLTTTAAIY